MSDIPETVTVVIEIQDLPGVSQPFVIMVDGVPPDAISTAIPQVIDRWLQDCANLLYHSSLFATENRSDLVGVVRGYISTVTILKPLRQFRTTPGILQDHSSGDKLEFPLSPKTELYDIDISMRKYRFIPQNIDEKSPK